MAETRINLYEGLFLLNQGASASDFGGCIEFLKDVLGRAEAEVLVLKKWDERKLAYPIEGQKRGVFILAIFKVRSTQIANIERDCNLSEQVVRCLITRGEHLGETEIELAQKEAEELRTETRLREDAPAPVAEAEQPVDAAEGDVEAGAASGTEN